MKIKILCFIMVYVIIFSSNTLAFTSEASENSVKQANDDCAYLLDSHAGSGEYLIKTSGIGNGGTIYGFGSSPSGVVHRNCCTLVVNFRYNNGTTGKVNLKIANTTYTITADGQSRTIARGLSFQDVPIAWEISGNTQGLVYVISLYCAK